MGTNVTLYTLFVEEPTVPPTTPPLGSANYFFINCHKEILEDSYSEAVQHIFFGTFLGMGFYKVFWRTL